MCHDLNRTANYPTGFVVLNVPRASEGSKIVKSFDVSASSLDCLIELCPDGKVGRSLRS